MAYSYRNLLFKKQLKSVHKSSKVISDVVINKYAKLSQDIEALNKTVEDTTSQRIKSYQTIQQQIEVGFRKYANNQWGLYQVNVLYFYFYC